MDAQRGADPKFDVNWYIVLNWSETARNVRRRNERSIRDSAMDQNTILKEQLTKEMIEAGARLTEELDKTGPPIQAALCFFDSEINEWRLLFASHQVAQTDFVLCTSGSNR